MAPSNKLQSALRCVYPSDYDANFGDAATESQKAEVVFVSARILCLKLAWTDDGLKR